MSTPQHIPQNETKTPKAAKPQRDATGRFARGNLGGPGNPFGRQVGELRKEVLAVMNQEKTRQLLEAMFERAVKGDMAAAKLLLAYSIGKPTEAPNPDRLDLDELGFFRAEAGMMAHAERVKWEPDPAIVLALMRATREAASNRVGRLALETFKKMDEREKQEQESGVRRPESEVERPEDRVESEVENPESRVDKKIRKPLTKEEFAALRERVRQNEEKRRQEAAAQPRVENGVAMHPPSPNGKFHPAAS